MTQGGTGLSVLATHARCGTGVAQDDVSESHMLITDTPEFSFADLSRIIRSEYLESPGLALTRRQIQRLWALDARTTDLLIESLLASGFLRRTQHNMFVRSDS